MPEKDKVVFAILKFQRDLTTAMRIGTVVEKHLRRCRLSAIAADFQERNYLKDGTFTMLQPQKILQRK